MKSDLRFDDWKGRSVGLFERQWHMHIVTGHPEVAGAHKAVCTTVSSPDKVFMGLAKGTRAGSHREIACKLGALTNRSSLYLLVPIEYSDEGNWVVTAYVSKRLPNTVLLHPAT